MNPLSPGARFRAALAAEKPLQVIGAINANHALLAKRAGYRAIYLSGGGVAAGSLGLPDLGINTLDDVLTDVRRITDVQQSAAGYANYQQWIAGTQLEQRVSLEDYSVSNRGLRSGLVGTPAQVQERLAAFAAAGVDLVLLQFSPQLEEMEAFSKAIISPAHTI